MDRTYRANGFGLSLSILRFGKSPGVNEHASAEVARFDVYSYEVSAAGILQLLNPILPMSVL